MPTIRIPGSEPGGGAVPATTPLDQLQAPARAQAQLGQALAGGAQAVAGALQRRQEETERIDAEIERQAERDVIQARIDRERLDRKAEKAQREAEKAENEAIAQAERTDGIILNGRRSVLNDNLRAYQETQLDPENDSFPSIEKFEQGYKSIIKDWQDRTKGELSSEQGGRDFDAVSSVLDDPRTFTSVRSDYFKQRKLYEERVAEEEQSLIAGNPAPFVLGKPSFTIINRELSAIGDDSELLVSRLESLSAQYASRDDNANEFDRYIIKNTSKWAASITDPKAQDRLYSLNSRAKNNFARRLQAMNTGEMAKQHALDAVTISLNTGSEPTSSQYYKAAGRTLEMIEFAKENAVLDPVVADGLVVDVSRNSAAFLSMVLRAKRMSKILEDPNRTLVLSPETAADFSLVWPSLQEKLDSEVDPRQQGAKVQSILDTFGGNLPPEAASWLRNLDLGTDTGLLVMANIMGTYIGRSGPLPRTLDAGAALRGETKIASLMTDEQVRMVDMVVKLKLGGATDQEALASARAEQGALAAAGRESTAGFEPEINADNLTEAIRRSDKLVTFAPVMEVADKQLLDLASRIAMAEQRQFGLNADAAMKSGVAKARRLFGVERGADGKHRYVYLSPTMVAPQAMVDADIGAALARLYPQNPPQRGDWTTVAFPNPDSPLDISTYRWGVVVDRGDGATLQLTADGNPLLYDADPSTSVVAKRTAIQGAIAGEVVNQGDLENAVNEAVTDSRLDKLGKTREFVGSVFHELVGTNWTTLKSPTSAAFPARVRGREEIETGPMLYRFDPEYRKVWQQAFNDNVNAPSRIATFDRQAQQVVFPWAVENTLRRASDLQEATARNIADRAVVAHILGISALDVLDPNKWDLDRLSGEINRLRRLEALNKVEEAFEFDVPRSLRKPLDKFRDTGDTSDLLKLLKSATDLFMKENR